MLQNDEILDHEQVQASDMDGESSFEKLDTSKQQNDQVRAYNVEGVPPRTTVNSSFKIIIWGAMVPEH